MSMLWRAPRRSTWGCWPSLGGAAELHDGGHVDGLDELVEAHAGGWSMPGLAARMAVSRRSAVAGRRRWPGRSARRWAAAGDRGRRAAAAAGAAAQAWRHGGLDSSGGFGCRRRRGASRGSGSGEGSASGRGVAVEGELAAVGDDEGLVLFGH